MANGKAQAGALTLIIVLNIVVIYVPLTFISFVVALCMSEEALIGDDAVHGEEAYAFFGDGERRPVTGD